MGSRQNLIDQLAIWLGAEKAESLVTDLEATIEAKASAGASKAATKVVTWGLLGTGALGLFFFALSARAARKARLRA